MRQTVVGVFDRYASAQRAVQVLADSGFGPDAVHITDELSGDTARLEDRAERADDDTITGKIRNFFADLFNPDDNEVTEFSETLRRGGAVVKVDVDDEARVDEARMALERAGAMDIDEEGATGSRSQRQSWSDASDAEHAASQQQSWTGARPEPAGGVRVFTRPVDQPVEDAVRLREENIVSFDEPAYRQHFASEYGANSSERYEDYEPAYRYGSTLASDRRYTGRPWDEIEADARSDWERRYPGSVWERFKAAVRHAWETATH